MSDKVELKCFPSNEVEAITIELFKNAISGTTPSEKDALDLYYRIYFNVRELRRESYIEAKERLIVSQSSDDSIQTIAY